MAKKRDIYKLSTGEPCDFSVSQIIGCLDKPALVPWAAKMVVQSLAEVWDPGTAYTAEEIEQMLYEAKNAHRRRKDTAADIGTEIHKIVGMYVEGQLAPDGLTDPIKKKGLENFILCTKGWEWLGSEITLVNEEHRYGGTADGIARLPGGMVVLVDFKTSASVYATYSMQCALYAAATPDDAALRSVWKEIAEARILHYDKELNTWECLERDIKEQYPFIPHFVGCARWIRRFEQRSYSTKDDSVKIVKDTLTVSSTAQ